ncbi:MAG: HD-GYP domain-containing protein [Methylococcales bacterium]|nr:HD-GYP domain-containing protein [Methylococcales bacterium]
MNDHNFFPSGSTTLIQIDVKDLRVGMYVAKLDKPWLESNFWFQGFELKNQADIDAVSEQCKFVFVDVLKQNKALKYEPRKDGPGNLTYPKEWLKSAPPKKIASFNQEAENAGYVYHQTSDLVKSFMDEVRLGGSINVVMAKKAIAECVNSVLRSPDAILWMTQLKQRDLYTSQHSMNVAILAIAMGRHLNLSVTDINNLGLCGMMHDMGKMRIPLEILNKPGRFTPEEARIMNTHPEVGARLLMSSRDMYEGAIDVAYSHHEWVNGTGYPRKLTAEQTTPFTKIVTIVDMYDAMTSDRIYQKGRTHLDATSVMTKLCGTQLDPGLTYKFIECMGIYPPGSVVEMTNGEIAIVAEVNHEKKLKPRVILLLDENKQPRPERIMDLSKMDLDASGQIYAIRKVIKADEHNIDLNKYYQNRLIEKALESAS